MNEEELKTRHSKEKRSLQAEIQKVKKSVCKGDRKASKQMQQQIAEMERALEQTHLAELAQLAQPIAEQQDSRPIAEQQDSQPIAEQDDSPDNAELHPPNQCGSQSGGGKMSRATRRREKKQRERQQQEGGEGADNEEAAVHKSRRELEFREIEASLAALQLELFEIRADGNCLFNAIGHQMELRNLSAPPTQQQEEGGEQEKPVVAQSRRLSGEELRNMAADEIEARWRDYAPFVEEEHTHTARSEEGGEEEGGQCEEQQRLLRYTRRLRGDPNLWGGQLELMALSRALCVEIRVVQRGGAIHCHDNRAHAHRHATPTPDRSLLITYHRFAFGLGEHYNSTAPQRDDVTAGNSACQPDLKLQRRQEDVRIAGEVSL